MATLLSKPVSRFLPDRLYPPGLVVTLTPEGIYLREHGRRLKVGPLDLATLYTRGVRAQVEAKRVTKTRRKRITRGLLGAGR